MINNVVSVSQCEPLAEFESLFTGERWKKRKKDRNKRPRSSSLHLRVKRQLSRTEPDHVHSGASVPRTLAPQHTDGAELTVSTLRLVDEKLQAFET